MENINQQVYGFCTNCGASLNPGQAFCTSCGAPVQAAPAAEAAPTEVLNEAAPTEVLNEAAPTEVLTENAPTEVLTENAPTEVLTENAPEPIPAPQPVYEPAPQPVYTAPQPAPQPVYTAPQPAPQPVYTAPQPAPQPVYTAPQPAYAPAPNLCANCRTELAPGQAFCSTCGMPAGQATPVYDNAAINQFNANVEKKKSKKLPIIIISIIAAVAVLLGAIFGISAYQAEQERIAEEQRQEAIAEYKANALAFCRAVLSTGSTMEDIGNEIKTSWSAYVTSSRYRGYRYYSVDSAVDAAQDYMASEISTVKNNRSNIESLYQKLLTLPDSSDPNLVDIRDAVKAVYADYQELYEVVITPSGNWNTWTSAFKVADSGLADSLGDLNDLVAY